MKRKASKRPSLNSKLRYDEHGNLIVGTFSTQERMLFNAYSCGSGYYEDKSTRNRKGKAAQKERNKLRQGIWE